jgi:hypothetical protein
MISEAYGLAGALKSSRMSSGSTGRTTSDNARLSEFVILDTDRVSGAQVKDIIR